MTAGSGLAPVPNGRLLVTRAVLWFLVGTAAVVTGTRFVAGLGRTTALSDSTPWGLWIGFDVLGGVAMAAGGFVLAAFVHVFGRDRYRGIVRPAVLTAFLGYLAVILGLLADLGRPWNIWRPVFHWNLHSPLFEVAMCVMLYTTVLALEFAPVVLERLPRAASALGALRRATLPLVILGIALSTLHQSSLGALFLLSGARLDPLWFSPRLPLLFLVSAVGLGLGTVTVESLVSGWLYRRRPEWDRLRGLARVATFVLLAYLVLRLGDVAWRGELRRALEPSWVAALFWGEVLLSSALPMALFLHAHARGEDWPIGWGASLMLAGFLLHRAAVGGIAHLGITGGVYVPAPTEVAVSLGIVSGLALVFLFFVEKLQVWEEPPEPDGHFTPPAVDPVSAQLVGAPWLGAPQRAVLAMLCGAVAGTVLVEAQLAARRWPESRPAPPPRSVAIPASAAVGGSGLEGALLLGPRERTVVFPHEAHQRRLGGQDSCPRCHHRNVPLDRATSCSRCHRDVYRTTDTFEHALHVDARGGRTSCAACHPDPATPLTRAGSRRCDACHPGAPPERTHVRAADGASSGMAPGYASAMHGLCEACHRETEAARPVAERRLGLCPTCHESGIEVTRPGPGREVAHGDLLEARAERRP